MNLSDPNPGFKVIVYLQVEYLKNGASYGQSYYRTLIGNRLGLAIVPLCRGTGAPFDEHRRPLAPLKFFDNNGNDFSVDRQHYR